MTHHGWRKPTPALARASAFADAGEELSVARNQAVVACKRVAVALGLRAGDLHLLDALVAFSHPVDWEQGSRPIVWPSNELLMARTGLSLSALKRRSRRLSELGLICYRDSSNGKRFGHRDGQGRIVEAYGFDLSPLAARVEEFEALHVRLQEERALCSALKRKITVARRTARAVIEAAIEQAMAGAWQTLLKRLTTLVETLLPKCRGLSRLTETFEAFDLLVADAEELYSQETRRNDKMAEKPSNACKTDEIEQKMNPREVINEPHIPITTEPNTVKSNSNEDLKRDGPQRAQQPEIVQTVTPAKQEQSPAAQTVDIAVVMQSCPGFADMARGVQPYVNTWRDLEFVADRLRPTIGISEDAWTKAKTGLGAPVAAAALALITDKYALGEVASPGGYLRGLLSKAERGELNLQRSFYGRLGARA